ncbi:MAG: citrate synthase/methylcitrate synthase [Acidobacteriota bacterium]
MSILTNDGEIKYAKGLEGVIAAISSISFIDGGKGILVYRGHSIETLAKHSNFEEVAYLLIYGELPTKTQLDIFSNTLKDYRTIDQLLTVIKSFPLDAHPMDVIRSTISLLGIYCPDRFDFSKEVKIQKVLRVIAKLPTIVAAYSRLREGLEPISPDPSLGHAENFLYMLNGKKPDPLHSKILDINLILHADHGMNASTFSSMVTISTLSDVYSSITSGIGTLKGPLHGGANERVLKMLDEIGDPANVKQWLDDTMEERKKIMGFGHRVYTAYDPRAKILKKYAKQLGENNKGSKYFQIGEKVEKYMIAKVGDKGIQPNVDFYSGIVFNHMGIKTDLFTPIFAISRSSGWGAHLLEYLEANRLFRPRAIYNGPLHAEYIKIEEREGE